ncbi:exodeoxyribonuclease VII large subunit [Xanthobacter tagetidis]|uniref:Exodeoxyribonuclease 7 large subunit n=1 Tax=Xanthobacter tagetidis TaxID=60216 RepID=A0A3L7A6P9_9HYPH|nr:exodeoxyribonuclease VII large subunit [Xanthobacter tagetidis]MBB6307256.1 exodeoxyribonuclease VII large subunit [Xanthobacter tagetidis]RLP75804.1 exodeoxyribonuclease VII large subunit [Xanthobacter tagetidis]
MADHPDTRVNAPEWSVSELSAALRRTVEDAYGHVRVRGEISGYRGPHSSGHAYFSLKDQSARLDAVIWKGTFARLRLRPEEGLEVVATGRLTTYPGKSGYQIVIEALEFAGAGAIMAMLEERKLRLQAEGLFDPARKKKLPYLPRVIGVVTSPTGAVIRDILHRLADRFPRDVVVWPVRVQGETSAAEVAAAIRGFNALAEGGPVPRPDVIVVARGGGSLEDLLGFSEEVVVRAAAESAIPLVSAVGHETDVTLIDFAADLRAPTPTAAAELVVPVRSDLIAQVEGLGARLSAAPVRLQERRRAELRALSRLLPTAETLLQAPRQRLDGAADRLPRALAANALAHRLRLAAAVRKLSPEVVRGRMARAGDRIAALGGRLAQGLSVGTARRRDRFAAHAGRFDMAGRAQRAAYGTSRRMLADLSRRAGRAMEDMLRAERRRLASLAQLLDALSYHGVLARGFALVRDAEGQAVRAAAAVAPGAALEIEFADGRVAVRAGDGEGSPPRGEVPARRTRKRAAKAGGAGAAEPTLFDR